VLSQLCFYFGVDVSPELVLFAWVEIVNIGQIDIAIVDRNVARRVPKEFVQGRPFRSVIEDEFHVIQDLGAQVGHLWIALGYIPALLIFVFLPESESPQENQLAGMPRTETRTQARQARRPMKQA
jgi:hypothetical protein